MTRNKAGEAVVRTLEVEGLSGQGRSLAGRRQGGMASRGVSAVRMEGGFGGEVNIH